MPDFPGGSLRPPPGRSNPTTPPTPCDNYPDTGGYRVAIVGVDDEEVSHLANSKAFVTVDGTDVMDASELAAHIAVAKSMKRFGTRRMLSFHSRISRAKKFAERLPKVIGWLGAGRGPKGEVWAEPVQGSMPVRERLLLVLPDGDLYNYSCTGCGASLGTRKT